jgi:hypothetical protein
MQFCAGCAAAIFVPANFTAERGGISDKRQAASIRSCRIYLQRSLLYRAINRLPALFRIRMAGAVISGVPARNPLRHACVSW